MLPAHFHSLGTEPPQSLMAVQAFKFSPLRKSGLLSPYHRQKRETKRKLGDFITIISFEFRDEAGKLRGWHGQAVLLWTRVHQCVSDIVGRIPAALVNGNAILEDTTAVIIDPPRHFDCATRFDGLDDFQETRRLDLVNILLAQMWKHVGFEAP